MGMVETPTKPATVLRVTPASFQSVPLPRQNQRTRSCTPSALLSGLVIRVSPSFRSQVATAMTGTPAWREAARLAEHQHQASTCSI
jgi:hypothetical protein